MTKFADRHPELTPLFHVVTTPTLKLHRVWGAPGIALEVFVPRFREWIPIEDDFGFGIFEPGQDPEDNPGADWYLNESGSYSYAAGRIAHQQFCGRPFDPRPLPCKPDPDIDFEFGEVPF
jgi:hypothetical protein